MIKDFKGKMPDIHESCFIAENAVVIGDVSIGEDANVWFGTVIRGDINKIRIGKGTNIQENSTLHVNEGDFSLDVGEYVTVGHNVVLHGCKIGNKCLIGMGSIILDGAEIGENTIIGAGSLVTQNKKIPSGMLCMGSPARVIRELSEEEISFLKESAKHYIECSREYKSI